MHDNQDQIKIKLIQSYRENDRQAKAWGFKRGKTKFKVPKNKSLCAGVKKALQPAMPRKVSGTLPHSWRDSLR